MRLLAFPALAALVVLAGCDATEPTAESIDFDNLPALTAGTTVIQRADLKSSIGEVVRQPSSWFLYDDETDQITTGFGRFVTGPATPPAGVGSLALRVNGSKRRAIATYQFARADLASITALGFSTYNPSQGNGGAAFRSGYLGLTVTFDGSNAYQGRINFVPKRNGAVVQNTWQDWDALDGGNALWVWSGFADNGGAWPDGNTSVERTWSDIVSSFPGIAVNRRSPWVGVRVGSPYADGYGERIDRFVFGFNGVTRYYDFEP